MRPTSPPLSKTARSRRLRRRVNVATIVVLAASVGVAVASRSTSPSDGAASLVGQVLGSSVENEPSSQPLMTEVTESADRQDSVDTVRPNTPVDDSALVEMEAVISLGDAPWSVVLVGDSLLQSAVPEIVDALAEHVLRIDAGAGRTLDMGLLALAEAADSGADIIVVALGTNDWGTPADHFAATVVEVMDLLADTACVVWIDSQDFNVGHSAVNSAIVEGLRTHPRSVRGSWSTVAGEIQLHQDDGYHLSVAGRLAYADTIADGLSGCVESRA